MSVLDFRPRQLGAPLVAGGLMTSLILAGPARALAQAIPSSSSRPAIPRPHVIYVEIGGNGLSNSVNYEHVFSRSLSARVGITIVQSNTWKSDRVVPLTLNYLRGDGRLRGEFGLGLLPVQYGSFYDGRPQHPHWNLDGTATIGVRFQSDSSGLVMRAGVGIAIHGRTNIPILPLPGVSAGWSF